MRTIPLTAARARLNALVDEVERTQEPVWISRRGYPAVVLVSRAEWQVRTETSTWGGSAAVTERADSAERELLAGSTIPERVARERFSEARSPFVPLGQFPW